MRGVKSVYAGIGATPDHVPQAVAGQHEASV